MSETITNDKIERDDKLSVSGPQLVQHTQPTTYRFKHGLGRAPLIVQIQFSPDEAFDDIHVVQWPWNNTEAVGPVSVRADSQYTYLEFTFMSSNQVFGAWSASTQQWARYNKGFFRVITG